MDAVVQQKGVGRFSAALPADLVRIEAMVAASGSEAAGALRRAHGRDIDAAQYVLMVDWAGYMIIQQGLSHASVQSYLDALGEWFVNLNRVGVLLDETRAQDLEAWNKSLYLEKGQHSKTRNVKLSAVRQFYEWRELQGDGVSPMRSVKSSKVDKRTPRKYTDAQLGAMFAACDREALMGKRDYAILLFFYSTGARRMEVASLSLNQLEVKQKVARVKFEGKGAKERVVSFEGPAVMALVEWLMERDRLQVMDTDAVFVGLTGRNKGGRLGENGLDDVVYRAVRRGRIRVERGQALHTLRVTFATDLYDQTKDIKLVQKILGHESSETTDAYIAISETVQKTRLSAKRVGELVGSKERNVPRWFEHQQRGLFPAEGEDL